MLYLAPLILFALFVGFFFHDKRHLLNPILLIALLATGYLAVTSFLYDKGYATAHQFLLLLGFGLMPIVFFLSALFLIFNGIVLLKKEGKSTANFLSLGVGFLILLVFVLPFIRPPFQKNLALDNLIQLILFTSFFSIILLGGLFAGFLIYSIHYNLMPKRKDYDFIIIHGAGLLNGRTVTPLLKKRIDKAVEAYHLASKDSVYLIPSGGQRADEQVSEAHAIASYLENIGFPRELVLLEEQSRTTYENLLFSKAIGQALIDKPRFLFVTNDYHVLRTSLYAR